MQRSNSNGGHHVARLCPALPVLANSSGFGCTCLDLARRESVRMKEVIEAASVITKESSAWPSVTAVYSKEQHQSVTTIPH